MSLKLTGMQKVTEKFRAAGGDIEKAAKRGVREIGEEIMTASAHLIPVVTDHLRESRHLEVKDYGNSYELVMSYRAEYAIYVHERPVDPPTSNGQRKYLERPLLEREPRFAADLAAKVRKVLAG